MVQRKKIVNKKKRVVSQKKRTAKMTSSGKIKRKLMIWFIEFILLIVGLFLLFLGAVYGGVFGALPSEKELASIRNHEASQLFSADGVVMGRLYEENRISVPHRLISPHVLNALIATEDARFFEHNGIDRRSLFRVMIKTLLLGNKQQGGGSTISMQLARNLFPRSYHGVMSMPVNKVKEAVVATRINRVYTKEQILDLYLNTVSFGENIYGIETASQRFFSKPCAGLNEKEAATLVGMLAANSAYNPRMHPEKSKQRRNIVLERMAEQGYIAKSRATILKKEGLGVQYHRVSNTDGIAPYLRDRIRRDVQDWLQKNYGDEYNLYTDGLKVYTTVDSRLQGYAEEAIKWHMARLQKEFDTHWNRRDLWEGHQEIFQRLVEQTPRYQRMKSHGATKEVIEKAFNTKRSMPVFTHSGIRDLKISPRDSLKYYMEMLQTGFLAMDANNGDVLAWVGGVDFRYFQYDHVTSRRQVGSTFKPFVYAAAYEDGREPGEYISNERKIYHDYDDWSPRNSGGRDDGWYSIEGGMVNSVNTITAELMMQTGIDKVLEMARKMGVESPLPAVPSLALGVASVSLAEMVTAYSAFVHHGRSVKMRYLLRIEDNRGNVLGEFGGQENQEVAFSASTNRLMNHGLQMVVDSGTARSLRQQFHLRGALAGKTGTTQNNADGWFIGYTPRMVLGSWVGGENPLVHFRTTRLGQGAHMALPVAGKFLQLTAASKSTRKWIAGGFEELTGEEIEMVQGPLFTMDDPAIKPLEKVKNFFGLSKKRQGDQVDKETGKTKHGKKRKKRSFFDRLFGKK